MALFGLGYGISKAAGLVSGLLGYSEEERKGIQATAAMLTMVVDPVGSVAALGMLGIREGAKEGNGVCQAIVVGTTLINAGDILESAASVMGDGC